MASPQSDFDPERAQLVDVSLSLEEPGDSPSNILTLPIRLVEGSGGLEKVTAAEPAGEVTPLILEPPMTYDEILQEQAALFHARLKKHPEYTEAQMACRATSRLLSRRRVPLLSRPVARLRFAHRVSRAIGTKEVAVDHLEIIRQQLIDDRYESSQVNWRGSPVPKMTVHYLRTDRMRDEVLQRTSGRIKHWLKAVVA